MKGRFVYRQHQADFDADEPADYEVLRRERNEDLRNAWVQKDDVVLPYDEQTWAGLQIIRGAVDRAHAQLAALVERKDLAERLGLLPSTSVYSMLPDAVGDGAPVAKKRSSK